MIEKKTQKIRKGICIFYALIGFLFVFLCKSESDLFNSGNIIWNVSYSLSLLGLSLLGAIVAVTLYCAYIILLEKKCSTLNLPKNLLSHKKIFFISFFINIVSYMPYYLAFYPGICAYDMSVQLEQIVNHAYNDHHPLFHTLLIRISLALTGDVALCTLVQVIMLSLAFSFSLYTLSKLDVSIVWLILGQLYFSLNRLHGFMAVSITKDTLFTAFFVLTISSLILLLNEKRWLYTLIYVFGIIGSCLFRNNGKYAVLVLIISLVVAMLCGKKCRKEWLSLLFKTIFSFLMAAVLLKTAFLATNATAGDKREMLSVPLQQIARTVVYEEDKLTDEEKSLIDELILYRAYDNYNPVISDPVKGKTNTSVVRYQTGRFADVYFDLLKKYPGDYINAVLALIGGYVSPFDKTFRLMEVDGKIVTRNYIQHTFTATEYSDIVSENSKWPWLKERLDAYAENDAFMKPFIKLFYIPGIYIWILLIAFVRIMEKKKYNKLVPLLFVLAFFGTLLLGPTMHLRYVYPVIVATPLLVFRGKHET